ncbi:hypothetical protein ACLOJK_030599 [Asimina triloba]
MKITLINFNTAPERIGQRHPYINIGDPDPIWTAAIGLGTAAELHTSRMQLSIFFLLCVTLTRLCELAAAQNGRPNSTAAVVDVGVVLDLETWVGTMSQACISVALSDFYASRSSRTRLVLHTRDSKNDIVGAAAEVLDLMKNVEVKAIIGPITSAETDFAIDLGMKAQVPIMSFSATSPSLNSIRSPYFIRTTLNDSSQVRAISAFVRAFGWREVVPIYENSDYGNGIIPFLTDAFQEFDAAIPYRSVLPSAATDDQILEELYKLMNLQTRVFVVHVFTSLGSRLFSKANEIGMMSEGYVWIITDGLAGLLDSLDSSVIESMQGVIGVKTYIPKSKELDKFTIRWKRKILLENPSISKADLSILGLRAYDTVQSLAMAAERVGAMEANFQKPNSTNQNSTDLQSLGVFQSGPKLLQAILNTTFKGLSGEFRLADGQIQPSVFQLINVVGGGGREIGFWTPDSGLSRVLTNSTNGGTYSTSMGNLKPVMWPGESRTPPKGWVIPTAGKELRIGVPVKDGFSEFVNVDWNSTDGPTKVTGFCIDVFDAVIQRLPYALPHRFVPFADANGKSAGTYDDLTYQVYLQKLDMVVGDTTIVANRSLYVDFSLPYTESGVSMVVPIKQDQRKNAWIFLKPLSRNLWVTSAAAFVFTGFVVWVLEHGINDDFRGPPSHQIGVMFWFSFSTLVFAHSCVALRSPSSGKGDQQLVEVRADHMAVCGSDTHIQLHCQFDFDPTITDVSDLISNGDFVGYQRGSFMPGILKRLKFDDSKLKVYNSPEEYADALSRGSANGGVSAIFDEIPYIRLFLGKYCGQYMMVGPTYKTDGFGFALPIGSPLVADFSRAILNVTESNQMTGIERKWFESQSSCSDASASISSNSLTLDSFWGLFLIAGAASVLALLLFTARFLYRHWHVPVTPENPVVTFRRRIAHLAARFDGKDLSSHTWRAISIQPNNEGGQLQMGGIRNDAPRANVPPQSPTSDWNGSDDCPADGEATPSEPANTPPRPSASELHHRNPTPAGTTEMSEIRT